MKTPQKRSPLRALLAEAVAIRAEALKARDDAASALAEFEAALMETGAISYAARAAKEQAEREFADAMQTYAGNEVRVNAVAIEFGKPLPREHLVEVTARAREAEENYSLGKGGLNAARAKLNVAENNFKWKHEKAMEAIYAVERESIPALIEEATKIQDELIIHRAVIKHLCDTAPDMRSSMYQRDRDSLRQDANGFLNNDRLFGRDRSDVPAATASWNAARAAMLVDPDAPLPVRVGG